MRTMNIGRTQSACGSPHTQDFEFTLRDRARKVSVHSYNSTYEAISYKQDWCKLLFLTNQLIKTIQIYLTYRLHNLNFH